MPIDTITEALSRFKLAVAAEQKQRDREQADLRFQFPDQHWSADAKTNRDATIVGGMTIPARPMLSIPKLDQPIQLILNQERSAKLSVTVHKANEEASDDTAEIIQGLYRSIEVKSRANLARTWAFDRAVKAGRGVYRILSEYDEDGGHPSDQRLVIKRVLYQGSVYLDPFAQEPDWSDGAWAFLVEDMPLATFKRRFKTSTLASMADEELLAIGTEQPGWIGGTDEASRTVRVAEYWRKVYETEVIPAEGEWPGRDKETSTVWWSTITAREELGVPHRCDCKYIPLVPVIGRELQPVDGERRWTGVIGPNKDAQRMFDYAASAAVEGAALETKASHTVDPEAIEGYEAWWKQKNTRNFPYLPYRRNVGGRDLGPPELIQADMSKMQINMMLLQQADSFIHAGTGAFEPSLGQESPHQRSGRAVLALQQQHDQGTSNYLDNLAELSMQLESKIVLDWIPKVYDRPGRIVQILALEDKPQTVMLNQAFVQDPQTKRPRGLNQGEQVAGTKHYDLTKGRYITSVTIGKSKDSRLQEGTDEIGQILQAEPALIEIIGPTYFKFRDFPGSREIADLLTKMRDQKYPFLADEQAKGDPAKQAAQLQQENAMLKQQMQQAVKAIETKQIEQQGKVQVATIQEQADTQRNRENNETKLAVAELGAKVDRLTLFLEERARLGVQQHEHAMGAADAGHEERMAQQQQQAAQQMADQQHAQQLEQGAQGHQQALEQGQQAADLAPAPQDGAGA